MDLREYPFQKVGGEHDLETDALLLMEAKTRGFYGKDTKYNQLFLQMYFRGEELVYQANLPPAFKKEATEYLHDFMQSWATTHEDKDAICAMLLSELVEVV